MPRSDQGIRNQRYHVIPRTLIFLFNDNDQVLLLKGSKDKRLWRELFNGIGGHVESGEDILEAAQRELMEETGISQIDLTYCGQIMIDVNPEKGVAIFVFRGETSKNDFSQSREGELMWIDLEGLDAIPLVEDLTVLLPRIRKYHAGEPLIIGKYHYADSGKIKISLR